MNEMIKAERNKILSLIHIYTCEESLEDYFKRVTGGEGIA